ncbi:MAG: hypothetical protein N3F04_06975 [Candidatus Nezhaarchaeota archaeon]|nr:hypothetical protein [Candidatus Nezhaarchaeota archaeon]MCX8142485.1 hypothetical protein [Candidatus Nezhaarchaeota archaeon]MDW8050542.1 hypothetical protein [Nitrososphaerota archaeon]
MIEISGADEIYRRYFVMNMFDGALAALGVIMGMWVSGIKDSRAIIRTVLAAGFAMFLSGFLGAYLTEKAERERKIREIEEAMFMRMSGSLIEKSSKLAIILVSVVDGISPLIACVILVLPFIVVPSYESNFEIIASASLSIGMITLSALGLLLSRVARERSVKYPLYMILAGLVSAMIIILLGGYV